ncbi:Uncharacterised protein [Citrobacter werkmanii]|nr:Uncharacterised protein [Citrobacter werkmanii]
MLSYHASGVWQWQQCEPGSHKLKGESAPSAGGGGGGEHHQRQAPVSIPMVLPASSPTTRNNIANPLSIFFRSNRQSCQRNTVGIVFTGVKLKRHDVQTIFAL